MMALAKWTELQQPITMLEFDREDIPVQLLYPLQVLQHVAA